MFCSKCGNEIAKDAGFCHICGMKIPYEEEVERKQEDMFHPNIEKSKHNRTEKSRKAFIIVSVAIIGILGIISFIGIQASHINNNYEMAATEETFVTAGVNIEEAEKMIKHWLIDYPIEPDFYNNLSLSEEIEVLDYEGNDSWKFDLWVDGEEYATILVNKDDGDMVIEYSIWNENDRRFTSNQMPIERWYAEVYLTEAVSGIDDDGAVSAEDYNSATDEICFSGIPVSELVNSSSTELVLMFGGGYDADGSGRIAYNEITFYMLDDDTVDNIWSFCHEYFSINGYTLTPDSDGVIYSDKIVELLGEDYEYEWLESGYYMTYTYPSYTISFGINKYFHVGGIVIRNRNTIMDFESDM